MFDQRYYTYIKAVADCKSFSKAADQLFISQSFLSHFVKNAEEDFGTEFFNRKTIPVSLTAAGIKYLDYMEQFHDLESRMRADFASMGNGTFMQLSIASLRLLGIYALPKIIPQFVSLYPSVKLEITEGSIQENMWRLENGKADLVISNLIPDNPQLTCYKIFDDPVMLAVPYTKKMQELFPGCANNLNQPVNADLSLFKNETLIVLKPSLNMRIVSDSICRRHEFHPARIIEAPSPTSALSLLGGNCGITFICRSAVYNILPETPILYVSVGEIQDITAILAIYRKNTKNPVIHEFCSCARNSQTPAT